MRRTILEYVNIANANTFSSTQVLKRTTLEYAYLDNKKNST